VAKPNKRLLFVGFTIIEIIEGMLIAMEAKKQKNNRVLLLK
jgi:hypothetical protein